MEQLKLTSYLTLCLNFEQDPSEDNERLLQQFLSQVEIKEYLPMKDKIIQIMHILSGISSDFDEAGAAAFLEVGRVMRGLLSYCVNLEDDTEMLGIAYSVYDKIRLHGLYHTILKHCQEDFDVFTYMLRDSVNIAHIQQLASTTALFNEAEYDNWVKTIKDLQDTLTPEIIAATVSFNQQNSEATRNLINTISDQAVQSDLRELNTAIYSDKTPNDQEPQKEDSQEPSQNNINKN